MAGNKHDNGVHEIGTPETLKAYQEDTPGQEVEKYLAGIQEVIQEKKSKQKKAFTQVFQNPLKGFPYNEQVDSPEEETLEEGRAMKPAQIARKYKREIEMLAKRGQSPEMGKHKVYMALYNLAWENGDINTDDPDQTDEVIDEYLDDIMGEFFAHMNSHVPEGESINEVTDKEINAVKKLSKDIEKVKKDYFKITKMGDKTLQSQAFNRQYESILKAQQDVLKIIGDMTSLKLMQKEEVEQLDEKNMSSGDVIKKLFKVKNEKEVNGIANLLNMTDAKVLLSMMKQNPKGFKRMAAKMGELPAMEEIIREGRLSDLLIDIQQGATAKELARDWKIPLSVAKSFLADYYADKRSRTPRRESVEKILEVHKSSLAVNPKNVNKFKPMLQKYADKFGVELEFGIGGKMPSVVQIKSKSSGAEKNFLSAVNKDRKLMSLMDETIMESVDLQEGTWQIPDSYDQLVALQKFLSKPHKAKTAREVHQFHIDADRYFGDDSFSDKLDAYYYTLPGGDVDPYDKKEKSSPKSMERAKKYNKIKPGTDLNILLMKALTDWTGGDLQFDRRGKITQMPRKWYERNNPNLNKKSNVVKAKLEQKEVVQGELVEGKLGDSIIRRDFPNVWAASAKNKNVLKNFHAVVNTRNYKQMKDAYKKDMKSFVDSFKEEVKEGKMDGMKLTGQEISVYFRRNPVRDKTVRKAVEIALDHGGAMNYAIKKIEKLKRGMSKNKDVQKALNYINYGEQYRVNAPVIKFKND